MSGLTKLRKLLTGAASSGLSAAPSGNPYLIGGAAIGGGILNALTPERKFDAQKYRSALDKLRASTMARADRRANERGSSARSDFASRGISGGVAEGVIEGSRRMERQNAQNQMDALEFDLETDIADVENTIADQNRQELTGELVSIGTQGSQLLSRLSNPSPFDSEGLRKLRSFVGMENVAKLDLQDIINGDDIDVGGGIKIKKDSNAGKLYSTSSDFFKALGNAYGPGLESFLNLLDPVD